MHFVSLELMSITGKNTVDDFPGCSPSCMICVVPAHEGRDELNNCDVFQSTSRSAEESFAGPVGISSYYSCAGACLSVCLRILCLKFP